MSSCTAMSSAVSAATSRRAVRGGSKVPGVRSVARRAVAAGAGSVRAVARHGVPREEIVAEHLENSSGDTGVFGPRHTSEFEELHGSVPAAQNGGELRGLPEEGEGEGSWPR